MSRELTPTELGTVIIDAVDDRTDVIVKRSKDGELIVRTIRTKRVPLGKGT